MARRVRLNPSEARKFSEIINEAILDSPNAKRDLAKVRKELEQEFKVARATAKRLRDHKKHLKSEAEKNIRESRKLMQRAQKLDAADRETEADAAADKAADLQIKAQAMMGEFKTGSIQSKKLVDRLKEIQSDINRVDKLISALDAKEDRRRRGIPDPTSPGQERSKREKAQKAAFAELVIFYKDRVKPHVRKYPTAAGDVEFVEGQLPVIRRKLNRGDDVSFELRRVDKAVRDLHKLVKPRKTKRTFADVRRGLEAFVEETARLAKEGAPQKEVDQVLFELDEFSRSFSAKEKADFTMDERREMSRSIRKIQKALRMMKGRRKKNPCIGLHFHGKDADELLAAMEASAKRQKLEAKKNLPNPMHKVPKGATKAQVRSTVSKNIALLMEEGYPQKQAVAISLTRAREDAPGKVKSIYGPSPNPSTNPYLGDAVTKAKAKMAKKRGRSTPPPLPAKMKKKKMSSRRVSNPPVKLRGLEYPYMMDVSIVLSGTPEKRHGAMAMSDATVLSIIKDDLASRSDADLRGSFVEAVTIFNEQSKSPSVYDKKDLKMIKKIFSLHKKEFDRRGMVVPKKNPKGKTSSNPGRLADASAEELMAEYDAMKKSGHRSSAADMSPKELESAFKRLQKRGRKSLIEKGIDPDKLLAEDVKKAFGPRARVGKGRKLVIDKSPLAKDLIAECRALWESYCERPGKVKLRKIEKHCDAMKASKFKTVKDERRRCMNAMRREMKKLGMK